jgi:hypothetical protein
MINFGHLDKYTTHYMLLMRIDSNNRLQQSNDQQNAVHSALTQKTTKKPQSSVICLFTADLSIFSILRKVNL